MKEVERDFYRITCLNIDSQTNRKIKEENEGKMRAAAVHCSFKRRASRP